jgi:pimeloyl-ACP methyl ester carboxylesterase
MNTTVEINDMTLNVYQTIGDNSKATLFFLHDSLGCVKLWRDFPNKLGSLTGCSVLVYDRQGYGESSSFNKTDRANDYMELEADVLDQLMSKCEIGNAILFGHSDGGTIALIAAAKYPARIKGVITEGAHIFVENITVAGIQKAVEAYESTDLKQRLEKYHGSKTDGVFWAWAKTWLAEKYRGWNIQYLMPNIICPVLIIQGENDEYGTLEQVNGIVENVSGKSKTLIIPNVGHTPHKEATEAVLEHSTAFIQHFLS